MSEKIKEQKLLIAIIVIAGCLIFYTAGNATNLFGNPAFSMFWIISNETAHGVATYGAIAAAVAVVLIGLTITLIKKRKTIKPQSTYNPFISRIKTTYQTPVKADPPTITLKMKDKIEENKTEQKKEPIKQPIIQLTEQSAAQRLTQPTLNKTNNQEIDTNKPVNGKLTCSNCKKQFSTPLFMLEYVQSKPKLVGHCPYCDQTLKNSQKDA